MLPPHELRDSVSGINKKSENKPARTPAGDVKYFLTGEFMSGVCSPSPFRGEEFGGEVFDAPAPAVDPSQAAGGRISKYRLTSRRQPLTAINYFSRAGNDNLAILAPLNFRAATRHQHLNSPLRFMFDH